MRADSPEFSLKKSEESQEPIFVVEISFDLANTDKYYVTTHDVTGITGEVSQKSLKMVSGSSQKLNPSKANSTIGGIRFEVLDFGTTDLMRTKLTANKGLRGKRVRVWKGFKGFLWSQYRLINTYIISDEISFKNGVYTFSCSDIQRSMKNKIFIETSTAIMAPLAADATEVTILDASKFNLVYQVPSATGVTLLRGLQQRTYPPGHAQAGQLMYPQLVGVNRIGLVRIPGADVDEIAIWTAKSGNKLTGMIRGVFGTTPVAVEVESGITVEDAPKISEYVYIDMPAVKAVYALLTGSIYDAPGEFLPDHWHLGISTDFVQTSSFTNIGSDLWDLSDDDKGFPVVIKGEKDVEAKKYIEEKIYYMLGIYSPINTEGELTLKRMQYIGPNGSYVRLLDENNVIDHSNIKYNLSEILNTFIIKWNFNDAQEKFTRTSAMFDPVSIQRNGASDVKIIELKTLHGSRHSDASIRYHFDSLRSRCAGPPIQLSVTLTPDEDGLEVGDIVRLSLKAQEDFTNDSGHLNRNYEIQQVSTDNQTGRVTLNLFGSSQRASDIIPDSTEDVDDTFLTAEGTEINATNFPGAVSSAGGVTTITGNITLNGHLQLNNSAAIYYCAEDLTISASANVTLINNVQLRVKGFLQINAPINGKGNGLTGGVADDTISHYIGTPLASNLGKAGIGITTAQDGTRYHLINTTVNSGGFPIALTTAIARPIKRIGAKVVPQNAYLPRPELKLKDGVISGLPDSLLGSSGSSGGPVLKHQGSYSFKGRGGNGGNGGAGLCVFSKGAQFGSIGSINLSGGDADPGVVIFTETGMDLSSGAGAGGAPGGLLFVTLDSAQSFPDKIASKMIQKHGTCPKSPYVSRGSQVIPKVSNAALSFDHYDVGFAYANIETNSYESNTHIIFLNTKSTPVEDLPPYVVAIPTFTLTEKLNTPVTPKGDRSTIEVSVTRPIFGPGQPDNYSYSVVDYRISGTSLWLVAKPASHESVIEVPSDGATYEVRIRAVSKDGFVNDDGPRQTIATTNVFGRNDADLSAIYPFDAIVNLALQGELGGFFSGRDANFEWNHSNSSKPYFNYYEIEVYGGATLLRTEKSASPFYTYSYEKNAIDYFKSQGVKGLTFAIEIRVSAVSKYLNNIGAFYKGSQATLSVESPPVSAPEITLAYSGSNAILTWDDNDNDFREITTTIKYLDQVIAHTTGNQFVIPVNWLGSRMFIVTASHMPTNDSISSAVSIAPSYPSTPVISSQVIANNITFNYKSTPGSLPINRYEIRKNNTYNQAQVPDIKSGDSSFTVYQEASGGTKIYWFEAVDEAGNRSPPVSVSVQVSQPQNYQLLASHSEKLNGWAGSKTNCFVGLENTLILPVSTTDTWAQHFTNNSFSTPQDQINAGFEKYLQPSLDTAQYVANFDMGSVVDSAIISANTAPVVLDGAVSVLVTIEYSEDSSTWTSAAAGQIQVLGTSFRYVRVTLDFSAADGDDLAFVEDVLIKLDKQIDQDYGKFQALAADVGGTRVYFNKDFIDAQTPSVSVSSSEIVDVVVDFNDIPDPEYFDVYVFSRSTGNRINASGSWQVNGFTRIN